MWHAPREERLMWQRSTVVYASKLLIHRMISTGAIAVQPW
jgi:hypothetical protein